MIPRGSCVYTPEGYTLPAWTPSKTVAATQFFLINPVERPIDRSVGTIRGNLCDLSIGQIFDKQVVFTHICRTVVVGGKFREHQRRRGQSLADLFSYAICQ